MGWLVGPQSIQQLDDKFGSAWLAAKRFGVRQGTKIRPIDDFSAHGQNATVTTPETVPLGGVDAILCMARWAVGAVKDNRNVVVPDGTGKFLTGVLHADWSVSQARTLVGRCVDLHSAYKQLLREKCDGSISIVAVWNPHIKSVELYESEALPFGSTGSVYGFNRCSYALRQILIMKFRLVCTSFFDDFPCLEYQCLADHSGRITVDVLQLLGWEISMDKLLNFSQMFCAIGVQFDFQGVPTGGAIVVQNTAKRKAAIIQEIDDLIRSGFIEVHEAAALRGRMQYGEAQHWGRVLSLCSTHLSIRANGGGCGVIAGELYEVLQVARWLIGCAPPRVFSPWGSEECNLIFVDGAAEPILGTSRQRVTIGGVIFSHRLSNPQFFGLELVAEIVDHWQKDGSKQVIGQGELFPVLIAKEVWADTLSHARNLFFIDNESAREALIRNYSPSWSSRELILRVKILDARSASFDWYARVPTCANWADGPSRLRFEDILSIGGQEVKIDPPSIRSVTGVSVMELLHDKNVR